jgi:hypothetical protein
MSKLLYFLGGTAFGLIASKLYGLAREALEETMLETADRETDAGEDGSKPASQSPEIHMGGK